jgi:isoleucyl-tRNA synthetase
VPERPNFPQEEEKVLAYWKEINAFHKQLELSKGKPEFTFYDGPPFATGLPHYGHIAAGTIKVGSSFASLIVTRQLLVAVKIISDYVFNQILFV